MIGSTMLSVNAQGNPDNPLLKMDDHTVPAFNEYNISQIKPAFDVAIKERLNEIDNRQQSEGALEKTQLLKWNAPVSDFKRVMTGI
jgi:peptidyl-dipeptidase Dcp